MDFVTMEKKMENNEYVNFEQFSADFDLIIANCIKYNAKDTVFYKAAVKLRDQGGAVIRSARRAAESIGFDSETGLHTPDPLKVTTAPVIVIGDRILSSSEREHIPLDEQLKLLLDRFDEAQTASPSTPHCMLPVFTSILYSI
jgi:bromodomain and PHD finger-containing protein 1